METSTAPALTDPLKPAPTMTGLEQLSSRSPSLPLQTLSSRERSTGLKGIKNSLGLPSLAIIRTEPVIECLSHVSMNGHDNLPTKNQSSLSAVPGGSCVLLLDILEDVTEVTESATHANFDFCSHHAARGNWQAPLRLPQFLFPHHGLDPDERLRVHIQRWKAQARDLHEPKRCQQNTRRHAGTF